MSLSIFRYLGYITGTTQAQTDAEFAFQFQLSKQGYSYGDLSYRRTIYDPAGVSGFAVDPSNPWVVFGSHGINNTGITNVYSDLSSLQLLNYGNLSSTFAPARTTLFYIRTNPASGTYTFSAPNDLTFRTQDGELPFGSYPGVGTFFT